MWKETSCFPSQSFRPEAHLVGETICAYGRNGGGESDQIPVTVSSLLKVSRSGPKNATMH